MRSRERRTGLALAWMALGCVACDRGDWAPVERTARTAFNGWDMWSTAAVSPYKTPMPLTPEGTVPFGGNQTFEQVFAEIRSMESSARGERARVAYRRYCHHCHGPSGDGRIIVGESFAPRIPDLRRSAVQTATDRDLLERVMHGSQVMIPLEGTLTPQEALLAIGHVRTLGGAPSEPFFAPRDTVPGR